MRTTREFLAAIKQRHGLKTDGQLARFLNLSRERISRYQHGSDYLGDETAVRVAAALEIEPGYVLACVAAERTRSENARREWSALAKKLQPAVIAALCVTALLWGFDGESGALLAGDSSAVGLYIMLSVTVILGAAVQWFTRGAWRSPQTTAPPLR